MSLENAKAFIKKIEEDAALSEEYKALLLENKDLSQDEILAKVISFAVDKGFEITAEDIKTVASEKQDAELSDEELDAVAGGKLAWGFLLGATFGKHGKICIIAGYAW